MHAASQQCVHLPSLHLPFLWFLLAAHFRQCYNIQSPNVNPSSSACSSGSRDDYCSQSCANGWTRTAGTIDHWCQGGRYSGAPVICKRSCLTFNRPNFIASCDRIYLRDSFAQYAESWNRYVVYPATADIIRDTMWSLSNGIMRASTSNPCLDTAPAHLALHPNRWDLIIPLGGLQAVSARVMVNSSTAIAGLTAHFQSESSNYMVTLSKTQGLRFYRNTNVEIARVPTAADRINVGEWFTLGIAVTNGYSFTLSVGNTSVWSGGDPTQAGPMWGSAGMWADGDVSFANFTISGASHITQSPHTHAFVALAHCAPVRTPCAHTHRFSLLAMRFETFALRRLMRWRRHLQRPLLWPELLLHVRPGLQDGHELKRRHHVR